MGLTDLSTLAFMKVIHTVIHAVLALLIVAEITCMGWLGRLLFADVFAQKTQKPVNWLGDFILGLCLTITLGFVLVFVRVALRWFNRKRQNS